MHCEACGHENIDGARFCAKCGALVPTGEQGTDPLIGQIIGGRYRITGILGEGGMGIVYAGEQQMGSTVRKVAVKTLHAHLSKDPSVLARFHRECGTVAQLEHPNTIKFYDFGATEDGTLYIAMEFVKGEPLADSIEHGGAMPPARVLKIMRQIAGALDEAHEQGIVHRDLKPENVILTTNAGETDFVKVLDFGIAARTESADQQREQKLTQQGMVLGTPPYMSPEQFTGKELDRRSDIYSLGVMAYEMLTGRLPFEADTPWQWATQHMTAQPTPFEASAPHASIPESMRQAIMKALAKDRQDRQATAKDFYADLSAGSEVAVTEDGPPLSFGSAGTAAMAAVPDFGPPVAGPPPMMAPAPVVPMGPAPMGPGPMMPVPGAIPPAPPLEPRRSGGAGIVIGLVVLLVLLLGAIGVVAAVTMIDWGGDDDDVKPIALDEEDSGTAISADETSGSPTSDSTTPVLDTATAPDAGQAPNTGAPTPTATSKPTSTGTPTATATATTKPTSTGTPTATATATATSKPPEQPSGAEACRACVAAARAGNVSGAAANYRRCDNPGAKAQCSSALRGPAQAAVRAQAMNGDCAAARQTAASARAAGVRVTVPAKCQK